MSGAQGGNPKPVALQHDARLWRTRWRIFAALVLLAVVTMIAPHSSAADDDAPARLTWICVVGITGDGDVQCFDRLPIRAVLDCGNGAPITAYDGGRGTMRIRFDDPIIGADVVVSYGTRSYNSNYWPGQDVLWVFPLEGEVDMVGVTDGMESCDRIRF